MRVPGISEQLFGCAPTAAVGRDHPPGERLPPDHLCPELALCPPHDLAAERPRHSPTGDAPKARPHRHVEPDHRVDAAEDIGLDLRVVAVDDIPAGDVERRLDPRPEVGVVGLRPVRKPEQRVELDVRTPRRFANRPANVVLPDPLVPITATRCGRPGVTPRGGRGPRRAPRRRRRPPLGARRRRACRPPRGS